MADGTKIHSICLVKNEADVIEYCLTEAAKWSDYIYVYDGMSTDGTWEIVKGMNNPRVIAWKQDGKVFREGLRAEVFEAFRHQAKEGDWWLQLNGDEFYVEDPRILLSRVPSAYHVVWADFIQYYITQEDVDRMDFSRPAREVLPQLRYYNCNFAEPRFFRHRNRLVWGMQDAWPAHMGLVYSELSRFKHYPYRSPQQIQMRLDVRREHRARGFAGWQHIKEESWQEKLADARTLSLDRDDGHYEVDAARKPRHLERPSTRMIKRLMHGVGIWP